MTMSFLFITVFNFAVGLAYLLREGTVPRHLYFQVYIKVLVRSSTSAPPLSLALSLCLSVSLSLSQTCLLVALTSVSKIYLGLYSHALVIGLVLVFAAITKYHRLDGLINRNLFLTVLEVRKSKIKVQKVWVPFGESASCGDSPSPCGSHDLLVVLAGRQRERCRFSSSFIRTFTPPWGSYPHNLIQA